MLIETANASHKVKTFAQKIEVHPRDKHNVIATLITMSNCLLFRREFTGYALGSNEADTYVIFVFTLMSAERVGNVHIKWENYIIQMPWHFGSGVLGDHCRIVHTRPFTEQHTRILGIHTKTPLERVARAQKLFSQLPENKYELKHAYITISTHDECNALLGPLLPNYTYREIVELLDGGLVPDIVQHLASIENGDTSIHRNDQVLQISNSLVSNRRVINDPYTFRIDVVQTEPFYLTVPGKLDDDTKMELLEFELQDKDIKTINDMPMFAEAYCDLFRGKKSVNTYYTNLIALFVRFMKSKGHLVPNMESRKDIPPKIYELVHFIVEGTKITLCAECGSKASGDYCSARCEAARLKFQCSNVIRGKVCGGTHLEIGGETAPLSLHLFCVKCKCPAVMRSRLKTKILNPHELVEDISHIPAWKSRLRSVS
jgi:hypothetical protein